MILKEQQVLETILNHVENAEYEETLSETFQELWTPLNVSKKTFRRVRRRSWMEKSEEEIVKRLRETEKPISATRFAKAFDVSRQIIVGDVSITGDRGRNCRNSSRVYVGTTFRRN